MPMFRVKLAPAVAAVLWLAQSAPSISQTVGSADAPALTVLVRHADRPAGFDPPLNAAGMKRAEDLAAALHDTRFSAIIATDFIRTGDTAGPIARALGIVAETVPRKDRLRDQPPPPQEPQLHVNEIEAAVRKYAGEVVLVVDHSDTLPAIIEKLGGPGIGAICDSVYDNLFVLVPTMGKMQFVHSRYGVPTPPGPECPTMQMRPAR
jgi:phosphohistidine phosphatase SixA